MRFLLTFENGHTCKIKTQFLQAHPLGHIPCLQCYTRKNNCDKRPPAFHE